MILKQNTIEEQNKQLKQARGRSTPLLRISTTEPAATIKRVREILEAGSEVPMPVVRWDAMNGMTGLNKAGMQAVAKVLENDKPAEWPAMTTNPTEALAKFSLLPGEQRDAQKQLTQRGSLVFVMNLHRWYEDPSNDSAAAVVQGIWNLRDEFKKNRRTLVLLTPGDRLPVEISQDVTDFDEPLPTDEQLRATLAVTLKGLGSPDLTEAQAETAVDALRGLSAFAVEQTVAMSYSKEGGLDVDQLWERKIKVVEQTQGLSVDRGGETFDDVEGSDNLKEFGLGLIDGEDSPTLYVRIDEGEKYFGGLGTNGGPADNTGITQDKLGVILREMEDNEMTGFIAVGHAGCGKTLVTKSLANTATKRTGRRVLSVALDLGAVTTSRAGESERAIRNVYKVIKSLARGNRVCFVMTCNDVSNLPAPLKRRFTLGTWMFDLPNKKERAAQWAQYVTKYGLKQQPIPDDTDWTPSDIRNVCRTAKRLRCTIEKAQQFVTLVAKSDPDAIVRLRRLADGKFTSASVPGVYKMPQADESNMIFTNAGAERALGREE